MRNLEEIPVFRKFSFQGPPKKVNLKLKGQTFDFRKMDLDDLPFLG